MPLAQGASNGDHPASSRAFNSSNSSSDSEKYTNKKENSTLMRNRTSTPSSTSTAVKGAEEEPFPTLSGSAGVVAAPPQAPDAAIHAEHALIVSQLETPSCVRWAPTSELELYNAEAAILGPIRPMICQRTVAGLNTIASLHEKVRRGTAMGAEDGGAASPTTVPFVSPLPLHHQRMRLAPLDADAYTSVILVHGFAGGIANWLPIWRTLAKGSDVYAVDLPGFARSVRPSHMKGFDGAGTEEGARDAVAWFMDSFARWFAEMQLGVEADPANHAGGSGALSSPTPAASSASRPRGRRVVLVGHSFGGYLCAQFAVRYPQLVDHLVLADPWGLPRYVAPNKATDDPAEYAFRTSLKVRFARFLFESFGTGGMLRFLGPMGKGLIPKLRPDFGRAWQAFVEDPSHFYEYTYHCNAAPHRIGELGFIALGKTPIAPYFALIDAVANFPRVDANGTVLNGEPIAREEAKSVGGDSANKNGSSNTKKKQKSGCVAEDAARAALLDHKAAVTALPPRLCGVSVLFGSRSWMVSDTSTVFAEQLGLHGMPCTFQIISDAGHQLMSDNPKEVADAILKISL